MVIIATPIEYTNVLAASGLEMNFEKFFNVNSPSAFWNAYKNISANGNTTNMSRNMKYGILQLLRFIKMLDNHFIDSLLFRLCTFDSYILRLNLDTDNVAVVPHVVGIDIEIVAAFGANGQMVVVALI